jgi:hypothetical protein
MPDSRRLLAPVDGKHALRGAAAALLAGAAALVFAAGLMTGWSLPHEPEALTSRCALPDGVDLAALGVPQRDRLARRAMICADLEHGRITAAEYRDKLDALERPAAQAVEALPESVWASSVLGFSSQYSSDSWSASQVLGPPDALPGGADSPSAWASTEADSRTEFLEVAFGARHRMSAIEIVESYNPGAVSRVELILADGSRTVVHDAPAAPAAQPRLHRRIDFACTDQPVAGVRVTLDSAAVPDWNEIDAIGGRPCAD